MQQKQYVRLCMMCQCQCNGGRTGAILSQQDKAGIWKPVAFISQSLNETEQNYEIYDKEMLAVMRAFYEWSHYLKGAKQIIEVLTDHQNLTYFRKPQNLNRRQARWVLDLQEFEFIIKHRSGKSNSKADILSRHADHKSEGPDNTGVILLKEEMFTRIFGLKETHDAVYNDVGKLTRDKWDSQVTEAIKR